MTEETTTAPVKARNGKRTPKKSLVSKLCEVQSSISEIAKTGYNDFQKYSYAEEAAIVSACRDELAARQIMLIPSIENVIHEGTLTTIETSYTFVDGETGEQFTTKWAGTGSDKQDKGLYKAITGSQKYLLLKTFLIPTGENGVADDPEHPARQVVDDTPRMPPPAPTGTVEEEKIYVTKYDPIAALEFSDGRKTSTFDDSIADLADHAFQNKLPVSVTLEQSKRNPKYTDLIELALDAGGE